MKQRRRILSRSNEKALLVCGHVQKCYGKHFAYCKKCESDNLNIIHSCEGAYLYHTMDIDHQPCLKHIKGICTSKFMTRGAALIRYRNLLCNKCYSIINMHRVKGPSNIFRFKNNKFNQELINCLKKKVPNLFDVTVENMISYTSENSAAVESVIDEVRSSRFSRWQVLSFPKLWKEIYWEYLLKNKVPYEEELKNNVVSGQLEHRFLIPKSYRPHSWKLVEPQGCAINPHFVST